MPRLGRRLGTTRSGVRYHLGEPHFGIVMTDKAAYVNTYAEPPAVQVVDLPIYRFARERGSLYGAFKRYFDDLWHNDSVPGTFQKDYIDLEISAGGVVVCDHEGRRLVALLRRHDGYWVLPKGHRMVRDQSLEETALREVCEETGLSRRDLSIERLLGYYSYDEMAERLKVHKVVHLYLMRCTQGTLPVLRSPDFADAEWWDISQPLPEMLYTYQKSYLHEIKEAEMPK
jgi:8-oxo-dGTP pyrophosphatase MutT (NUDIX family)